MTEENNQSNESIAENQSETEKEDNRLPYEKPKLRKHGKVNDTTLASFGRPITIDSRFGFGEFS